MKFEQKFLIGVGVFVILSAIGWIMNIVDIANTVGGEITGMFLFRLVGVVVAPLGAILGWFF